MIVRCKLNFIPLKLVAKISWKIQAINDVRTEKLFNDFLLLTVCLLIYLLIIFSILHKLEHYIKYVVLHIFLNWYWLRQLPNLTSTLICLLIVNIKFVHTKYRFSKLWLKLEALLGENNAHSDRFCTSIDRLNLNFEKVFYMRQPDIYAHTYMCIKKFWNIPAFHRIWIFSVNLPPFSYMYFLVEVVIYRIKHSFVYFNGYRICSKCSKNTIM